MSNWPKDTTKGETMTEDQVRKIVREELAAQAEASEPDYGFIDLASDLDIPSAYDLLATRCIETGNDLLRGLCVRLMREAGWTCVDMDDREITNLFRWAYAISADTREDGDGTAPSEAAAYRDMLEHAGVIK